MTTHSATLGAIAQARLTTPLGPMLAIINADGLAGLWFDAQAHHPGEVDVPVDATHPLMRATQQALDAYWAGDEAPLATLPLAPPGTAFQQAVWQALRAIPRGQTSGYGRIAQALGRPQAARAVGAAVGRNPVSVLVPCHRVLGSSGKLTGYAGGLPRKQALLQLEGVAWR